MHTGLDRLLADDALRNDVLRGRVGLLAHPAVGDARPRSRRHRAARHGHALRDPLRARARLRRRGAGHDRRRRREDAHGTPIRSLYGEHFDDLSPSAEDLDAHRHAARRHPGRRLALLHVHLDRGAARCARARRRACGSSCSIARTRSATSARTLEGRSQLPGFRSFVGLEPIADPALRSRSARSSRGARPRRALEAKLLTVVASSTSATALATSWDRPFVLPSPNMPTPETTLVYPGGCLLEGTNLSDGRGTTRPFEITGAPCVDGERLARELDEPGSARASSRARSRSARPSTSTPGSPAAAFRSTSPIRARFRSGRDLRRARHPCPPSRIPIAFAFAPSATNSSTTSPPSIC